MSTDMPMVPDLTTLSIPQNLSLSRLNSSLTKTRLKSTQTSLQLRHVFFRKAERSLSSKTAMTTSTLYPGNLISTCPSASVYSMLESTMTFTKVAAPLSALPPSLSLRTLDGELMIPSTISKMVSSLLVDPLNL